MSEGFGNIIPFKPKPRADSEHSKRLEYPAAVYSLQEKRDANEMTEAIHKLQVAAAKWREEIEHRINIENNGGSLARAKFGATMLYDAKMFENVFAQLEREAQEHDPALEEHFARILGGWQKIEDDFKQQIDLIGRPRHVA